MREINPTRHPALAALARDPLTVGIPAETQPDSAEQFVNWRWFIDRDGIGWALLDTPGSSVNTLSETVLGELDGLLGLMERVRPDGLAIRSLKPSGFIAGAEIREFADMTDEQIIAERIGKGLQVLDRLEQLAFPSVALIHGFCLGGGLELAMCCDIRVASEDAQIGQPEIKLGLIPGGGGTQRLPRLVGLGRAMLLNLTGDFVDARTAYEWGLVERVVPREELMDAALGIARTIAERSPVSVAVLRELARTTRDLPLEEGLRREADAFRRCLESEDGAEGVAAFLEKREPQFTGR
jgi:enoyl-CoA hydratase/carnithine racemase